MRIFQSLHATDGSWGPLGWWRLLHKASRTRLFQMQEPFPNASIFNLIWGHDREKMYVYSIYNFIVHIASALYIQDYFNVFHFMNLFFCSMPPNPPRLLAPIITWITSHDRVYLLAVLWLIKNVLKKWLPKNIIILVNLHFFKFND